MQLDIPPRKMLIWVLISCGITIFVSCIAIFKMPGFEVVSFFSTIDNVTEFFHTASSVTLYVNKSKIHRYLSERFETTNRTMPSTTSGFKSVEPDVSFSNDENIGSTLSKIATMLRVEEFSCAAIFNASKDETHKAVSIAKNVGMSIPDEMYTNLTADCKVFQTYRGYIMSPLTEEEENFPLAFSIVTYTDAEMFERLLRAIYRPQNYYCIHVDGSSSDTFFRAISYIANCFTNVFIASKRIDVKWGQFSVLEPELLCMEELWRYPKWKYFFTLTGQEFPLKNNFELVKILTVYNGANDVNITEKYALKERWMNTVPPHGLKPVKGSVHITVNRDYVDYILHNEIAKDLLKWAKSTFIPDETFFAILSANPQLGIRGTYKGEPEITAERPFLARYKKWYPDPCAGRYVRSICILTTGDLPLLIEAKEMIANKFFLDWDRVVVGCLEEKLFNDTRDEYLGTKIFNTSYYSNLDLVKNQVT